MCEAEDQVYGLEREIESQADQMAEFMGLVADCERGIITPTELRDRVERPFIRRRLYAA